MKTLPLAEVKSRLSELVADVEHTHERFTVTKHGRPAAVLIAPEDLESLEETLAVLSDRDLVARLDAAKAEMDAGTYISVTEIDQLMAQRRTSGQ